MALIRTVLQHPHRKCWAYVEYSDESKGHFIVLGGKEFQTEEEAEEWSKGFELFNYIWKDPAETKKQKLIKEKQKIESRLEEINSELL